LSVRLTNKEGDFIIFTITVNPGNELDWLRVGNVNNNSNVSSAYTFTGDEKIKFW
jgi:hypothetical protein